MRTIRVTGQGEIKLKPDITRLKVTVKGFDIEYAEALRKSAKETEQLRILMKDFGFESSDLKTLSFSVEPKFERYRGDDLFKQHHVGYTYSHSMRIDFPTDNKLLGKIMYALAHATSANPQFLIYYLVKDEEAAKNELLSKAVIDAKEKAGVLTQAAGVRLKEIQSIDYSWGQTDFQFDLIHRIGRDDEDTLLDDAAEGYDLDIEPDDKTVSDSVTVIWEIE